jgi:hypothetical protein
MDQVDTPAEFFAIDQAVDTLRCDAVEDLAVTSAPDPPDNNGAAWTTTVPRVERRSTGAMLCQYASAGRSASDCAVRPATTDYQRVCCCGRSAVTDCPLLAGTAPTTAPTEDDDDDDDKQKGVIKKIIGKFIDVIIGIVLAIFGHIDGSVEFWFGR